MKTHIIILSALFLTCCVSAMQSPSDFPPDLYTVVAARAAALIARGFPLKDTAIAELDTHNDPVVSCMVYEYNVLRWNDITVGNPNLSSQTTAQSYELLPGCVVPIRYGFQQN